MRLAHKPAKCHPSWLRPFFAAQVRRYGAVLEPSLVWARSPRLFLALVLFNGACYLFSLRLVMILPFFVVNLLVGLTPIPLGTFLWVSFVGMLPETILYANAGSQLARVTSLSGVLSVRVLASFAALGLAPLAIRKVFDLVGRRRGPLRSDLLSSDLRHARQPPARSRD